MPATLEDYFQLQSTPSPAASLQAQAITFKDDVMAKVRKARADRGMSLLAKEMGEVSSQLPTYGVQLRERTEGVNPLAQDQMTASARGQLLGELTSLGKQAEEQYGTIQEIIQAGANQLEAQSALADSQGGAGTGISGEQFDLAENVMTKAAGYRARLQDLKELKTLLGDEKTYLQSMGEVTTGPLASLFGGVGPGATARTRLEVVKDALRYSSYGGAFTETEEKVGKKWLPSSAKQESVNIKRIEAQIAKDTSSLNNLLSARGVPPSYIQGYMQTGYFVPSELADFLQGNTGGWEIVD